MLGCQDLHQLQKARSAVRLPCGTGSLSGPISFVRSVAQSSRSAILSLRHIENNLAIGVLTSVLSAVTVFVKTRDNTTKTIVKCFWRKRKGGKRSIQIEPDGTLAILPCEKSCENSALRLTTTSECLLSRMASAPSASRCLLFIIVRNTKTPLIGYQSTIATRQGEFADFCVEGAIWPSEISLRANQPRLASLNISGRNVSRAA